MNADLARLAAESDAILLDFDGPVCGLFAGYPASRIAGELVGLLQRRGVALPRQLPSETDPLEVLRWAGTTGNNDLGVQVSRAVLVGDSVSDIRAGRAAGVRTIGYANRAGKVTALRAAGADVVIESRAALIRS
jgi:HAD-hyrolase-like